MKHLLFILFFIPLTTCSQKFSEQDRLRGSITPERAWWDLVHYDLSVEVFPHSKSIKGTNQITYTVLEEETKMQIDLQEPMKIISVNQNGDHLQFERNGNVYIISLKEKQVIDTTALITIQWEGKPKEAIRAPWDGGIVWGKDEQGRPFIATANQSIGSSIWWPNKDHPYDEVDSLDMRVTVPKELTDVSNGRLISIEGNTSTKTFHWKVNNPINNYGINLNIGHYTNFSEVYQGEKGPLDMDYWVLDYNLKKAKRQFKQATMMMEAFEYWFGPYPFYEDSFKLVEAPYLGMEHQSSVTYGNKFQNGYLGRDLSGTGQGLKFDFIIIHEAGHEWFANSITNNDVADMWIHEGFTAYSENLYLDYHYDKAAAAEYVIGTRKNIINDKPVVGVFGLNKSGSGDMYYKGSNMLHTLRTIVNDDEKWRSVLRGMNKAFFHQTVSGSEVESYLQKELHLELQGFFDQYLRDTRIPKFEYKLEKNTLKYRFANCVENFKIPLRVQLDDVELELAVTSQWQEISIPQDSTELKIPLDYFILN